MGAALMLPTDSRGVGSHPAFRMKWTHWGEQQEERVTGPSGEEEGTSWGHPGGLLNEAKGSQVFSGEKSF
jgi:hypothetical protein